MENIKLKIYEYWQKNKGMILTTAIPVLIFLIHGLLETKVPKPIVSRPLEAPSADTYIPAGFVLIPIQVQNHEALNGILGSYGLVDLYTTKNQIEKPTRKVAKHIKILRAPLDPNQFAVLAPENLASLILEHSTPFYVVVQNPKEEKKQFQLKEKKRSRIIIDEES